MDSNKAFANHWDKMNPSAQKQACDHSRQLMEDAQKERERKQSELYKISWQQQCELYKLLSQKQNIK